MKISKILLLFLLLGIAFPALAQQKDTVISFDQLRAASSPAFNMLGISPTDIERPTTPTDFAISLANASNNFSTVPKSYALEIAPYWAFGGKSTFGQFIGNDNVGNNIKQSLVLSIGSTTANSVKDSSQFRQIGISVKFSILRGDVGDEFKTWKDSTTKYLQDYTRLIAIERDSLDMKDRAAIVSLLGLRKKYLDSGKVDSAAAIAQAIKTINNGIEIRDRAILTDTTSKHKAYLTKLSQLSKQTDFKRYGLKMDWAAGTVIDFPDSSFNRSYLSKFATWLTFGYEGKDKNNIMFLARYAANFNRFYKNDLNAIVNNIDIGDLDLGLRFYRDFSDKLTISAEYINRLPFYNDNNYTENHVSKPSRTDKYDLALNYKIGKNQALSFTYGKNFDNTYTKSGNLIAAVNFIIGLGSSRGTNGI